MKKSNENIRKKARIILYTVTLILVLSIFSVTQAVKASKYEREAMLTKQMALIALDENLNNISTNLEKTIYVGTPSMMSKLSTELWREASGAKSNLSILPTGENAIMNTYKFLSQVGEFVMALERKSSNGQTLSQDDRDKLRELYNYCTKLNEQVSQMCNDMHNGNFSFEEYDSTIRTDEADLVTMGKSFDDTEQAMTDIPTLIYDGPFSEHLTDSKPECLKGLEEIGEEKALEIAKKICINERENLKAVHEENGTIPCYVFKGEDCVIGITKVGGIPLYMLGSKFAGEERFKSEEAVRNALTFLKKAGYENMQESYYYTDDGICTINFAYSENGVIYYPDLIKVSVSLESGEVVSFDATGYISNHHERNYYSPAITEAQAKKSLAHNLEVIDSRVTVIPTEWKTEQNCYEFHCKSGDTELLVYIDCETGEEDNVLILLYSDSGVLTK